MINHNEYRDLLNRLIGISRSWQLPRGVDREEWVVEAANKCIEYALGENKTISKLSYTVLSYRLKNSLATLKRHAEKRIEGEGQFIHDKEAHQDYLNKDTNSSSHIADLESESTLDLILKHHPKLALSSGEVSLLEKIKNGEISGRYKADLARQGGVTRQTIYGIEKSLKKKCTLANDLYLLIDRSDIEPFFKKHALTWQAPEVKTGIWNVLKDSKKYKQISDKFLVLQDSMMMIAYEKLTILDKIISQKRQLNSEEITIAYHLLVTSAYIEQEKAKSLLDSLTFDCNNWLLQRFVLRAKHIINYNNIRSEYIEWMKYLIQNVDDRESRYFANYVAGYYGSVDNEITNAILVNSGDASFRSIDTTKIVKEIYENITEKQYKSSKELLIINFCRLRLIQKHFPMKPKEIKENTKNSLKTICQNILRHTNDHFM